MLDLIRRNKPFRILLLFFICNDSSVILLQMANGWLTLDVTNSVFWTGAVFGVTGLGVVSFSLFGGILADKINRKKILQLTQPVDFFVTLILGCLIYFEIIKLWEILLIVFINGAVGGVRLPTREALLLDVVGKIDLVKAISTTFLLYTVLGFLIPIITGNLIEINMSIVYFICSALIFLSFLFIKNLSVINNYSEHSSSTGFGLKEVIKYIYDNHLIKQILIIMLFSEIFGWSHNSMIPVMVRDIFKLPASNLGLILSCASLGAVAGTVIISQLSKSSYMYMVFGLFGFGVFLISFAISPYFYLAVLSLTIAWGFAFIFEIKIYSYLQLITSDAMRGRILSLLAISYGLSSVAGFFSGTLGKYFGVEFSIILLGVILISASVYSIFKLKKVDEKVQDIQSQIKNV